MDLFWKEIALAEIEEPKMQADQDGKKRVWWKL